MTTEADIEDAISEVLENETGAACYSNEVLEGFVLPAFFLKAKRTGTVPVSSCINRKNVHVIINYFGLFEENGVIRSETDRRRVLNLLYKFFSAPLKVGDRFFLLQNQSDELGGENQDILIFTGDIEFFDDMGPDEDREKITTVNIKNNIQERTDTL